MSQALNNDVLAELFSSLTLVDIDPYLFAGAVRWQIALAWALLLCLALLTKRTTLFLIPLSLVAVLGQTYYDLEKLPVWLARLINTKNRKAFWTYVIGLYGDLDAATLVAVLLHDGLSRHWWDVPQRLGELLSPRTYTQTPVSDYAGFVLLGFASFWANFGWMNIPLDAGWYLVLALFSLFAMAGGIRGAVRVWRHRQEENSRWRVWGVCILAVILIVTQALVSMVVRQMPFQGRYLYPAIVPMVLCFVWGFFEWIPKKYHLAVLGVWVMWWIAFDWLSLFTYILPYFYG